MKQLTLFSLFALPFLFLSGCEEHSPYKVVMVKGLVLVDDKPMEGISVIFSPVNADGGHPAGGVTDAAGKFTLTTGGLKVGKGAVPGKYNVLIRKATNEGVGLSAEEFDKRFSVLSPRLIYQIPKKYSMPQTSGIEPVIVEKGKKNEYTFSISLEGLEADNKHLQKEQKPTKIIKRPNMPDE